MIVVVERAEKAPKSSIWHKLCSKLRFKLSISIELLFKTVLINGLKMINEYLWRLKVSSLNDKQFNLSLRY